MRPTTLTVIVCAAGILSLISLPNALPWYTGPLQASVTYTCMSFSGIDSMCRIVLHYRVGKQAGEEDVRCTLMGASAATAIAAIRTWRYPPSMLYNTKENLKGI